MKKLQCLLMALAVLLLAGCRAGLPPEAKHPTPAARALITERPEAARKAAAAAETTEAAADMPDEDGLYTTAEDVAAYLMAYGRLPRNFITKAEARRLGWSGGDLRPYARDACIGGDRFGNYEGLLPERKGRRYYECDIDTLGKPSRGSRRLVYSNDGLIYYSEDHYASFTLLFGEDNHAKH